jgi:hypothetical protein
MLHSDVVVLFIFVVMIIVGMTYFAIRAMGVL